MTKVEFLTIHIVPSAPPTDFTTTPGTLAATSIVIKWSPPPQTNQNGIITQYKLLYTLTAIHGINGTVVMLRNVTQYTIYNLNPSSNYSIQIAAGTALGFGPYHKPIVHLTSLAGKLFLTYLTVYIINNYLSLSNINTA